MDQIVSQLPRLSHLRRHDELALSVVFLLSPTFTSWVKLGHEFLPTALRHMYADADVDSKVFHVHSAAAIVDAIPSPKLDQDISLFTTGHEGVALLVTSRRPVSQQRFSSAINNSRAEEGEEAFITFKFWSECARYLTMPEGGASRDELIYIKSTTLGSDTESRSIPIEQNPSSGTKQKQEAKSSLQVDPESGLNPERSLQFADNLHLTNTASLEHDGSPAAEGAEARFSSSGTEQYDLPLSNTIFQNGRKFTMYEDTWAFEFVTSEQKWNVKGTDSSGRLRREEPSHLTILAIPGDLKHRLPLISLTRPREVAMAVGNVISLLSGGTEQESDLLASSELEKRIPAYIEQQGIQPGAQIQVYALVTPKNRRSALQLSLEDCLRVKWSRLHRVTSGGGGWGKKAGLLSLAPEISLDPQVASETNRVDIVAPGDEVQFFVAIEPEGSAKEQQQMLRSGCKALQDEAHNPSASPSAGDIVLGTIPAKDDPQYRNIPLFGKNANVEGHLAVFPGFFGMLTEKSMCMGHTTLDFRPNDENQLEVVRNSSIIGMPFASVAVRMMSPCSSLGSLKKDTPSKK